VISFCAFVSPTVLGATFLESSLSTLASLCGGLLLSSIFSHEGDICFWDSIRLRFFAECFVPDDPFLCLVSLVVF